MVDEINLDNLSSCLMQHLLLIQICRRDYRESGRTTPNISLLYKYQSDIVKSVSRGGSVSTAPGYRLDDHTIQVRFPAETKDFSSSLLCTDRLWGPPSLLKMGTGGPFSRDKARPRSDVDHSPPRSRVSSNYTFSSPCAS
jgi:hypothetical protein